MSTDTQEYLTVREIADRFRLSMKTVYRLLDSGALTGFRFSPHGTRVPVDEVERYELERRNGGDSA